MKLKTKMKRYIKKHKITVTLFSLFTLLGLAAHVNLIIEINNAQATSKEGNAEGLVSAVDREVCSLEDVYCDEDLDTQDWVFERMRQHLGFDEAIKGMMIIQCESGWNPDALNVNTNGTADLGLWQINHPLHSKTISRQQSLDYQIATDWAINKRTNDGNWSAWVCARILNIK